MSIQDPAEKTILIPVIFLDGKWQLLSGGDIPELKENTIADLVVPKHAFSNSSDTGLFTRESTVTILPKESKLWALISNRRGVIGPLDPKLKDMPVRGSDIEGHFFVGFTLEDELQLRLRGTKKANLEPCKCLLPGFPSDVGAGSINQAYTRLSEKYEPLRRSHSGNVFQQVWYESGAGGQLKPLEDLRFAAQIKCNEKDARVVSIKDDPLFGRG